MEKSIIYELSSISIDNRNQFTVTTNKPQFVSQSLNNTLIFSFTIDRTIVYDIIRELYKPNKLLHDAMKHLINLESSNVVVIASVFIIKQQLNNLYIDKTLRNFELAIQLINSFLEKYDTENLASR